MIKIENVEVYGWDAAIRGMRNPMNSWHKSDSHTCDSYMCDNHVGCPMVLNGDEPAVYCRNGEWGYCVGENDLKLMKSLVKAGTDHRKFMRMINVTADIVAPLYWWKEYDTYKVGTVANSTSTMHKIADKEFTIDDFSCEHLEPLALEAFKNIIYALNHYRNCYNWYTEKKTDYWWQMIQILPLSYNQRRTVQINYEVLCNMYHARKDHKLDCWKDFCKWTETLPYFKEICLEDK